VECYSDGHLLEIKIKEYMTEILYNIGIVLLRTQFYNPGRPSESTWELVDQGLGLG
jgi:hypothetical protein